MLPVEINDFIEDNILDEKVFSSIIGKDPDNKQRLENPELYIKNEIAPFFGFKEFDLNKWESDKKEYNRYLRSRNIFNVYTFRLSGNIPAELAVIIHKRIMGETIFKKYQELLADNQQTLEDINKFKKEIKIIQKELVENVDRLAKFNYYIEVSKSIK